MNCRNKPMVELDTSVLDDPEYFACYVCARVLPVWAIAYTWREPGLEYDPALCAICDGEAPF